MAIELATPEQAAWLRQRGQQFIASQSLIDFCQYVNPYYQPSRPHYLLASALERVERGECNRLIINFPRRHGKSLMVSQIFPCWSLGRNPRLKIVQSGYAESLTVAHSRKARDILASNRFSEVFPDVHHNPATEGQKHIQILMQTAHEWGTIQGGNYYAVGVGGGLAGRGYSIGIIDDPIRNRQDANSKVKRDWVWDWYRSVFYPAQDSDEIRRDAAIIICMTRWNVADLAALARAAGGEDGDNWEVLSLPAINEQGEALWPERWPIEKLNRIRAIIGQQEFSAQYQQSPRAEDGNTLDSTKLRMIDAADVPKMVAECRRWDLAFSDTKQADFVSGAKMGIDERGNVYIKHMKRIKGRWTQSRPVICEYADNDGLECAVLIEANGTQLGYYDDIKEYVPHRTVIADKPEGNKEMRASAWGTRLQDGIIYCVRGDWNQTFFDEMDFFPNAEHDDQVDAVSGGWNWLKTGGAHAAVVNQNEEIERYSYPKYNRRRTLL